MNHSPLRITIPTTTTNDQLELNSAHWNVLLSHQATFDTNYKNPMISESLYELENKNLFDDASNSSFYLECLKQSLIYLVTETIGDYPYVVISEKTWRAFNVGVPFMIVGAKHSIKKLQDFGFKTFSQWWDESYDELPIVADRIQAVCQELKKLSYLTQQQQQALREEMLPTLIYNRQHLKEYRLKELERIEANLL